MLESSNRLDEEHRLIARYAARLAAESSSSVSSLGERIDLLVSGILEFHMPYPLLSLQMVLIAKIISTK
jgi:hypothetical protein